MTERLFKILIASTILLITMGRLFYSLPHAPTLDTDAIFSVEAAKSITKTGIPIRIITNELYDRDYLAHYLLAGSIFIFGTNNLGYAMVNIFFGALTLFLTFVITRTLTKNKCVIFFAVVILGISSLENSYVINPRSYIQFQFFFLLTTFYFYKGFISKDKTDKYKILSFFSYVASVLSHYSGLILLPLLGFYILLVNKKWYKDKYIYIFFLFSGLFSLFITLINPSKIISGLMSLTSTGIGEENPIKLSFYFFEYLYQFISYLPFLSIFIFIGIYYTIKEKKYINTYYQYIFWLSFFIISIMVRWPILRYELVLFPLFIILSLIGIDDCISHIESKIKIKNKSLFFCLSLIIIIVISVLIANYYNNKPYSFHSLLDDNKASISYIIKNVDANDTMICTDRVRYLFYLRQCNYILKQEWSHENGKTIWKKLDENYKIKRDVKYVDNLFDLQKILLDKKVWIIIQDKHFDPIIYDYINKNSNLMYKEEKKGQTGIEVFLINN